MVIWFSDAEHPMDITMSRVRSASDTCDIYFTYSKVNHLLYTCSLDPFEDGILLDTSPMCMHRYCRSYTGCRGGVSAPRNKYTIPEVSLEAMTEEDGAAEATAAGHPAPV